MKLKGQTKPDTCCSPPSLNHLSLKRPLAAAPGKFDYAEKSFVSSPYEATAIPSPSDSLCSSASGKESVSSLGYKDAVTPSYGGQTAVYTILERSDINNILNTILRSRGCQCDLKIIAIIIVK